MLNGKSQQKILIPVSQGKIKPRSDADHRPGSRVRISAAENKKKGYQRKPVALFLFHITNHYVTLLVEKSAQELALRRLILRNPASPAKPKPISKADAGSGTDDGPGLESGVS